MKHAYTVSDVIDVIKSEKKKNPDFMQENFNRIYLLAKQGEREEIKKLLAKEEVVLDPLDSNRLFTPAAKCAAEKDIKAAELLRELGADVSKIAMAAASVGNKSYAEMLRKEHGALPNYIVMGAAMRKDSDYISKLQKKHGAQRCWIAYGAAIADDLKKATTYLSTIEDKMAANNDMNDDKIEEFLLKGAAIRGNIDDINNYLEQKNLKEKNVETTSETSITIQEITSLTDNQLIDLVSHAAYNGQLEKILASLEKASHVDTSSLMAAFYRGLGKGGHMALYHALMGEKELPTARTAFETGLIIGNHNRRPIHFFSSIISMSILVKTREIENLNSVIKRYRYHTTLNRIGTLIADHINTLQAMIVSLDKTHFQNKDLFLHQLCFIKDEKDFSVFAQELLKFVEISPGFFDFLMPNQSESFVGKTEIIYRCVSFINEAKKIRHLMHEFHFDYDEATLFLNNKQLRQYLSALPLAYDKNKGETYCNFPLLDDIKKTIISFACDMDQETLLSMMDKFVAKNQKRILLNDLEKYTKDHFIFHRERANSLKKAAADLHSPENIKSLLNHQLSLFKPSVDHGKMETNKKVPKHLQPVKNSKTDDAYYKIIDHANQRFSASPGLKR